MSGAVEVFRGIIFSDSLDASGKLTVNAYDRNIYLTKNTDTRKFTKQKASEIITILCKAFGIPVGTIEDTGYVIPKLIFENKTLWDMMVMSLTYTKKQTGVQYFIYSDKGKLCVGRFTKPTSRVVFEPGVNLTDVSRSTSIEDVSTQLRLYGKGKNNKNIDVTVSDAELIKKYGIMQAFESPDENTTASAAKQKATTMLDKIKTPSDEIRISCLGLDEVVAGSGIYLVADLVGASGGFYVASDSHMYEGSTHTMTLNLSRTEVIPELEYDGDTSTGSKKTTKKKKSKTSSSGSSLLSGIKGTDSPLVKPAKTNGGAAK